MYKIMMKCVIKCKFFMGMVDGLVEVDGCEIYVVKDLKVGLF